MNESNLKLDKTEEKQETLLEWRREKRFRYLESINRNKRREKKFRVQRIEIMEYRMQFR